MRPRDPERIHVCHILSGDLWAGAEIMVFHLLKGLAAYPELALTAVLLNEGRLSEELRKSGVPTVVIDEGQFSFPGMALRFRGLWTKRFPDVLHAHRYKENLLAALATRNGGPSGLISTLHGMPETMAGISGMKGGLAIRWNHRTLSRRFHKVVAVSHDLRERLVSSLRYPEEKVVVIYNGIEIPEPISRRQSTESFVVGSAGRLVPVKDYPLMVDIAREALHIAPEIRFELAGDGPEMPIVIGRIEKYRLQSTFRCKGFLQDIDPFYRGLDLYMSSSVHEGIPISVLEAMAHGLPIVAPNVGGLKEIIEHGIQGYLIEGRNPADFAAAINILHRDSHLRRRMGEAARRRVEERFNIQRTACAYRDLYLDVA
jgi:glycosyltransferase involved in cell wall biosynthesis